MYELASMRVPAFIVLLLASRITFSACQESFSAFTCAIGRSAGSPRSKKLATALLEIVDGVRGAEGYVYFYLYTKEHPEEYLITLGDTESLLKSTFNSSRPTRIITHGYVNTRNSAACQLPKNAFLNNGDYNVIIADWWAMQSIWGTIPLDYWWVSSYVTEVGSYVAAMINFLENHGMNLETTTLIGHSLGAHVMGIAGYQAKNKVNYIVGLDPALPSFESRDSSERLSIEDAHTVEVIHTNEGDCGMSYQIGHYDFYPNGGHKQPGCTSNTCSHSRVYELYAESIHSENGFYGRRCLTHESVKDGNCFGDFALMGGSVKGRSAREGIYYLETRDSSPFALGI